MSNRITTITIGQAAARLGINREDLVDFIAWKRIKKTHGLHDSHIDFREVSDAWNNRRSVQ